MKGKKLPGGHLIVPDIHGHLPRLQTALTAARSMPGVKLVFLGDLIDDSPRRRNARQDYREAGAPDDSREILRQIRELHASGEAQVLLGNHELMAISAVLHGNRDIQEMWWRFGGRETAAAYGWRGHDPVDALTHDLNWLLAHGKAWLTIGPPGSQMLLAHATRPHPQRIENMTGASADLLPLPDFDPVAWFPLGDATQGGTDLYALPDGYQCSVHGHMQGQGVRELPGPDARFALQIDLHPQTKKLALLHVGDDGRRKVILKAIVTGKR